LAIAAFVASMAARALWIASWGARSQQYENKWLLTNYAIFVGIFPFKEVIR